MHFIFDSDQEISKPSKIFKTFSVHVNGLISTATVGLTVAKGLPLMPYNNECDFG